MRRSLCGILLGISYIAGAWAGNPPAAPSTKADPGFEWSIKEGTQFNLGKLHIGAGNMIKGPYIDEKNVRRYGLYANIQIVVDDDPPVFQQPDVHEGQTLVVAGYKILIEAIIPGERGTLVFRVWDPPKE